MKNLLRVFSYVGDILPHQIKDYGGGFLKSLWGFPGYFPSATLREFRHLDGFGFRQPPGDRLHRQFPFPLARAVLVSFICLGVDHRIRCSAHGAAISTSFVSRCIIRMMQMSLPHFTTLMLGESSVSQRAHHRLQRGSYCSPKPPRLDKLLNIQLSTTL
jgi:hypothetical protein